MERLARYAYVALIWLYLVGLSVQIFFAGMGLFGATPTLELHRNFGYLMHLVAIPLLVAALLARLGSPTVWWAVALVVIGLVQPLLPAARAISPYLAALHPLLAVALVVLAIKLALESRSLLTPPSAVGG